VAYHLHWPHDSILALEHQDRARWVREIGKLNARFNAQRE